MYVVLLTYDTSAYLNRYAFCDVICLCVRDIMMGAARGLMRKAYTFPDHLVLTEVNILSF